MKLTVKYIGWVCSIFLLVNCGGEKAEKKIQKVENRVAQGTVKQHGEDIQIQYGGLFRMNESSTFKTLFPQGINDEVSVHIGNQIFESLVKLDEKTLDVLPCLAKSFTPNEDASVWTFKLEENVYFHDDACFKDGKGRKLTAHDIKYCYDLLGTAYPQNNTFYIFQNKVKGVNEHYEKTSQGKKVPGGVEGIKVVDDYTLEISLVKPMSFFPKVLVHNACWIFPKEAFEKYGEDLRNHTVGTGPFMLDAVKEGNQVRLKRNPNYWRKDKYGNQLPYLDLVKVTFTRDKKSELLNFKKDNLDMISKLPVDEMEAVLVGLDEAIKGRNTAFVYQQTAALNVQNYDFLHTGEIFKDIRIRKAFCYAIDRKSLVQNVLRGDGEPAHHGVIPNFPGYDNSVVNGYKFNPEKARQLLAEAGYPNGDGFPSLTLTLSDGGGINTRVAEALYNMFQKNLGIHVNIDVIPFTTIQDKMRTGSMEFSRRGWVADYPDASTFLEMYYGRTVPKDPHAFSMVNSARYVNPEFDALFEKAMQTADEKERVRLYQECDKILIEDAAFLPLYYADYVRLVKENVVGLPINAMDYRDLSNVFFTSKI
ncbi:MAG: ABC transporter substrate-binding protein [Flavobacteriales bacterium]|jgi:peptide/nickel transport system substrate-binding protein|nr:ABC transporter substrate-binding protein [Flavobacteriales bacterium]